MPVWTSVLELDARRAATAGSTQALSRAVQRGADLRIYTEFRHNEHIDTASPNKERIEEVSEFAVTYVVDNVWVAGIMSLRQPISLPDGFGPRPSMSFFLYNQDGQQAIARPHLDGGRTDGKPGPSPLDSLADMPKYHQFDKWDADTNAPSQNFVYDFERYRFCVCDRWQEMLSHSADGTVLSGSLDAFMAAFRRGCAIKVALRGLCADLAGSANVAPDHEVFIQVGPGYYYTEQALFIAGTHPLVRVQPAIPMRYRSRNWDFGWVMPRTDGFAALLIYDPYTLTFTRRSGRYAMRWFVSGACDADTASG